MACAPVKTRKAQLSLEFLVILAVLLAYLGSVLGLWKYSFDTLDLAAQRIAVNKVVDELEFYSRFLSTSKGESEISVTLFPTTKMAVAHDKETGIITLRSCSSQNDKLSYERQITNNAKNTIVEESLDGAACGGYPISGKARLLVRKTISGEFEIIDGKK